MEQQHTFTGYSEEIPLGSISREQFEATIAEVAAVLQWYPLFSANGEWVYQAQPAPDTYGEIVHFRLSDHSVLLMVIPRNEYYWQEEQLKDIARSFKEAFASVLPQRIKADRSRNPLFRERYGALLPSRTYQATPWLSYLLIFVFLLMTLSGVPPLDPPAQSLFAWGGNFREAVMDGQWWRLITYMFLHAGAMHLLMNLFALLYIGMYLEPVIGKFRLFGAYLLTGLIAGIASIIMHPFSVGVGASGAIFGLYGIFFSLLTTGYFQKTARMTMMRSLLFFVVFNLMMGLQGNTDNAAHIGGLLSGIVAGYIFYPSIQAVDRTV